MKKFMSMRNLERFLDKAFIEEFYKDRITDFTNPGRTGYNYIMKQIEKPVRDPLLKCGSYAQLFPELSYLMVTTCAYPRQRKILAENVARLCIEMKKGAFSSCSQLILGNIRGTDICCVLNGNTTLLAAALANLPVTMNYLVRRYETEEDMNLDYIRMDSGAPRTISSKTTACNLAEELGIRSRTLTNKVYAAIRMMIKGLMSEHCQKNGWLKSPQDVMDASKFWKIEINMLEEIYNKSNDTSKIKAKMRSATIIAFALLILRYRTDEAKVFLEELITGNMLNAKSPVAALRRFIGEIEIGRGTVINGVPGQDAQWLINVMTNTWRAWFLKTDSELEKNQRGFQVTRGIKPGMPLNIPCTPISLDNDWIREINKPREQALKAVEAGKLNINQLKANRRIMKKLKNGDTDEGIALAVVSK